MMWITYLIYYLKISETIESECFPNVDTVTVQAEAISIPPRQPEKTK